jgi:glutamine amidotransferase
MGNIRSIQSAFIYLGVESDVIESSSQIMSSAKLVLPGVGSFAKAMKNIEKMGILDALNESVLVKKVPILGICLGMQLLAESGDEDGPSRGLGWIPGRVRKIDARGDIKIPHIGFNSVHFSQTNHILFSGLGEIADFYFVHSYVLDCGNEQDIASRTDYGERFVSGVSRDNIFGVQFHPEKSQHNGLALLRNFAYL